MTFRLPVRHSGAVQDDACALSRSPTRFACSAPANTPGERRLVPCGLTKGSLRAKWASGAAFVARVRVRCEVFRSPDGGKRALLQGRVHTRGETPLAGALPGRIILEGNLVESGERVPPSVRRKGRAALSAPTAVPDGMIRRPELLPLCGRAELFHAVRDHPEAHEPELRLESRWRPE